jgi:hypothetical protein
MSENARSLIPHSAVSSEKMETLAKETGDFKTWVRTSKDGAEFLVNGEPIGRPDIVGVVVDFAPNWTRWPDNSEKPEKLYSDGIPDGGDDWKRRCDLTMMTPQFGQVVMDLPFSAFRNFGKYVSDVRVYGKSLGEIFTRAVIGKGKSKKFGSFNTIRFEIAGLIGAASGNMQKAVTLPEPEDVVPFDVDPEEVSPPSDDDFVPY